MASNYGKIEVKINLEGVGSAKGELKRFLSPLSVNRLVKSMPISGRISKLKEGVYFQIPLKMGSEKPKKTVKPGDMAYWPISSAICIFYGRSQPYSTVNLIGTIEENIDIFRDVAEGTAITIIRET